MSGKEPSAPRRNRAARPRFLIHGQKRERRGGTAGGGEDSTAAEGEPGNRSRGAGVVRGRGLAGSRPGDRRRARSGTQPTRRRSRALAGAARAGRPGRGDGGPAADVPAADAPAAAVDAALEFVAASPAALMVAPLEDLLGQAAQPNLPGTVDEHPNWRRRHEPAAATVFDAPAVRARVAAIGRARRGETP